MATEARQTIEQQAGNAKTQKTEIERATFALEGMPLLALALYLHVRNFLQRSRA